MKPAITVGVVIGAVILAAGLLAPLLQSSESRAARQAADDAELAMRLLHRHDYQLNQLARLADPQALKAADMSGVLEKTKDPLEQLRQENARHLGRLQAQAQQDGLPARRIEPPAPTVGGLQQAAQAWDAALKANDRLLTQAAQVAKAAAGGVGANVPGVAQTVGAVEYTRAAALMDEAFLLRQRQRWLAARLLLLAGQWKAYQADEQYFRGLEMGPIKGQIEQHLGELRALSTEAESDVQALASQVEARQQELAGIEQELRQARDELLSLEQTGFKPGDEASFQAYREKYAALSERLRTTEEREQLLRYGGYEGAQFTSDNLELARIEGGQVVVGLEKLQAHLAAAQERDRRLKAGISALEEQARAIQQSDEAAAQAQQRQADLLARLDAEQEQVRAELTEVVKQAVAKEEEALAAARSAAGAFRTSQQAADRWQRAARDIQSTKDTERKNPRLNMIVGDRAIPQIGTGAEAAALVLLGRIYASRIEAAQTLIRDMAILDELRSDRPPFDATLFTEQIATARQEALDKLNKACLLYTSPSPRDS